ncbi:hypothetical protein RDABS01_001366 [Bienertia sinuspersici]
MVEGMHEVVVTVSGYCGSERMKLIKLITHAGANYVGKMTKSVTHLICWKFEGEKYRFAKNYGILIVNHQWIEDCIKERKRIPVSPYTRKSGKEVGFSISSPPAAAETAGMLSENRQLLNRPIIHDYLDVINLDSDEIETVDWGNDPLLDENSSPKPRSRETARQRSKKKSVKETSQEESRTKATRRAIHELQTPSLDALQREVSDYSPKFTTEQRSDNDRSIRVESDAAEPSHRYRRLVKKSAKRCISEIVTIDADQQKRTHEDVNGCTVAASVSNDSTDLSIEIEPSISRRVETTSAAHGGVDEINNMNDLDPVVETSLLGDDTPNVDGRNMKETSPDENSNGDMSEKDQSPVGESVDLSCVICWTENSPIRGVLPCGHRFCFSCIQSWVDHMASSRKESTCPLCKVSFASITRVDATASSDQKIYSQTVPCPSSSQDIFIVPEGRPYRSDIQMAPISVCCNCQRRDPVEFLEYCQFCHSSCIHFYCLDPPLFPWTCFHCRDRRLMFRN